MKSVAPRSWFLPVSVVRLAFVTGLTDARSYATRVLIRAISSPRVPTFCLASCFCGCLRICGALDVALGSISGEQQKTVISTYTLANQACACRVLIEHRSCGDVVFFSPESTSQLMRWCPLRPAASDPSALPG